MRYGFDWYCDKHGWKVLVIEGKLDKVADIVLYMDDRQALDLHKFIGENFDVGGVHSQVT